MVRGNQLLPEVLGAGWASGRLAATFRRAGGALSLRMTPGGKVWTL